MKIALMCESQLLQKSLNAYLKDNLASFQECDFIISDVSLEASKPLCLISRLPQSDIQKPFTPTSLFKDLYGFYHSKVKSAKITANPTPKNLLDIKNPELKMQIDSLLEEFSKKIYQTLKNHNED